MTDPIISEVFANAGIDIKELPLVSRKPGLCIYPKAMTSSIMRSRSFEQHTVVISIHGYGEHKAISGTIEVFTSETRPICLGVTRQAIYCIPTTDHDYDTIGGIIDMYHMDHGHIGGYLDYCDTCPRNSNNFSLEWLAELLAGKSPLFKVPLRDKVQTFLRGTQGHDNALTRFAENIMFDPILVKEIADFL